MCACCCVFCRHRPLLLFTGETLNLIPSPSAALASCDLWILMEYNTTNDDIILCILLKGAWKGEISAEKKTAIK